MNWRLGRPRRVPSEMGLSASPPAGVLGMAALLLGAIVAAEAAGFFARDPAAAAAPLPFVSAPVRPSRAPVMTAALETAVLGRPVFSPARRPPAPANAADPTPGAPERLPRVTGVVISGAAKTVLFEGRDGARPAAVAEGGKLGGFTIRAIDAGGITVVSASGVQTLHPSFDLNAAPPSPALPGFTPGALPGFTPGALPGLPPGALPGGPPGAGGNPSLQSGPRPPQSGNAPPATRARAGR